MQRFPGRIKSLQSILYISLLAIILVSGLFVGIPMLDLTRTQITKLSTEQTSKVVNHIEQYLTLQAQRTISLSEQLVENQRLRTFLSSHDPYSEKSVEQLDFLSNRFGELENMYEDVISIFAFGQTDKINDTSRFVSSRTNISFNPESPYQEQPWYKRAVSGNGNVAILTPPHLQNFIKNNYIWVISLSRLIIDQTTGINYGVLLIDVNIDIIKDICLKNTTDTHYYYLINEAGEIIFHPHQQLIYSGLFNEPTAEVLAGGDGTFRIQNRKDDRIYTVRQPPDTGWKIVSVTNLKKLFSPFRPSLAYVIVWSGLSLLLLLAISRYIARKILNPINQLRDSMKRVEDGRFDISLTTSTYDEVGALAKDFNIMISKIWDLIRLNQEEHQKLRISDFKALQSQINPHFLYNTLDSVIWMSAKGNSSDVITMVSSLSKLLRRSLATGGSLVSLEDEYDHARQYFVIQKIRYRDRLDYSLELQDSCKPIPVPRLILQPLIENAIYHGIEKLQEGGLIQIRSELEDGFLNIRVSDNGQGADMEALEKIITVEEQTHSDSSVGLKNIHDRLKILFGETAEMLFRNLPNGFEVTLKIPCGMVSPEILSRQHS